MSKLSEIWSGTPDKPIFASPQKAMTGTAEAARGDWAGVLGRVMERGTANVAGQQQFAYQGKTPLAASAGVMGLLDRIMGNQIKMQNPRYMKEGRGGLLGGILDAGMNALPLIFPGGGNTGSTQTGAGLRSMDLDNPWVPPRRGYQGPTSTPFLGGSDY